MPVSVALDFVKPETPNYVSLKIYEATLEAGPYSLIETVAVTYPNYPTRWTTNMATALTNWFAIEWVDDKGAVSPRSNPVKGGTENVVGMIVSRVTLRDPTISEEIAKQEAEAVISRFYGVDPYSMSITPTYTELSALTYLVLARTYIGQIVTSSSGEQYTAGLVSQKSSTASSDRTKLIKWLLDQANILLGQTVVVMLMEDFDPTGIGAISSLDLDISRGIITEFT
jgi:hypothetical protein